MFDAVATTANGTALVLAAAALHPDGELRSTLQRAVHRWLKSLRPHHSAKAIARVIDSEHGTALEPFELREDQHLFATTALAAAFSHEVEANSVCVLGGETVGTLGGLLIQHDLSAQYRTRRELMRGRKEREAIREAYIAPISMPPTTLASTVPIRNAEAHVAVGETGIDVIVRSDSFRGRALELATRVAENSYIVDVTNDLAGFGLRVSGSGNEIRISTGSPESIIRFATLCSKRALLVVEAGSRGRLRPTIVVRLNNPASDPRPLEARYLAVAVSAYPWTNLDLPEIDIPRDVRRAIAEWYYPPIFWIDDLAPGLFGDAA